MPTSDLERINSRIETYLKETQTFIEKYNLTDDEFMKQLVSNVITSQKTLTDNTDRTRSDNYSRRLTIGRQRSHSISDDNNNTDRTQSSCFRNGTLDNIIQRVSTGEPSKI